MICRFKSQHLGFWENIFFRILLTQKHKFLNSKGLTRVKQRGYSMLKLVKQTNISILSEPMDLFFDGMFITI